MKVEGQCHCGQIRYEAQVDAAQVSIRHGTYCQTLTGTATSAQAFCSDCGTPITQRARMMNPKRSAHDDI